MRRADQPEDGLLPEVDRSWQPGVMADLRRRLERLPGGHPSAGVAGPADGEPGEADTDDAGTRTAGADDAVTGGPDPGGADARPGLDDRVLPRLDDRDPDGSSPGERPADDSSDATHGTDTQADPASFSRRPGGDADSRGHDPLLAAGPPAGQHGGYRPWFADGGVPAPWFATEVREDQDG